jgi:hypothetical protein
MKSINPLRSILRQIAEAPGTTRFDGSFYADNSCNAREAMTKASDTQATTFSTKDQKGIREFLQKAEIVEGPAELYAMVSKLWPELLHKVKPPRGIMH